MMLLIATNASLLVIVKKVQFYDLFLRISKSDTAKMS